MAFVWNEPKTDWIETDRFNIQDYNRIKNNLAYLHEQMINLDLYFPIKDMGEDITDYLGYWDYNIFNKFEENVDLINEKIENKNFGQRQRFFSNGAFIGYVELNRIESACLDMKKSIDEIILHIGRVPFRLGAYNSIRT